jgi:uncharacterized protein
VLASTQAPGAANATAANAILAAASLSELQQWAEKGSPAAEYTLGLRYAQGNQKDGVKQDEKEAVRWFTRAAEHGNLAAQSKLGAFFWGGRGVPQDLTKAYFWTVLARAGGDEGSKALAIVLASHLTRAQAVSIEQSAEQWFQQHQAQAMMKPDPGRR